MEVGRQMSWNQNRKPEPVQMLNYNNPYGYKLNVNHPLINKIYLRYKEQHGIASRIPLNDTERNEFERVTLEYLQKKGIIKNG